MGRFQKVHYPTLSCRMPDESGKSSTFAVMEHDLEHLYRSVCRILQQQSGPSEAQAVAFALLDDLFGASRTDVLMGRCIRLDADGEVRLQRAIAALEGGQPLQYATGKARFCGKCFDVNASVLIPRPETELLVELACGCGPKRVLDCGTGSGCIAVSVALALPDVRVDAWDISAEALAVARRNARMHGANVRFCQRDMLQLPARRRAVYDVIVSNPPYICRSEEKDMEAHVKDCEPHLALFVPDDDPLRFYVALAALGRMRLKRGGSLLLECNRRYADAVAAMLESGGYTGCEVVADCFGAPRMVRATLG